MPGAIIAFDQARPGPSTSFGSPGVARKDLWQNREVTARSTTAGNASYAWAFVDIPPGSASVLVDDTLINARFTPDLPGSYRVQLTTNGGGPGNIQILIAAVTFDNVGVLTQRGWRIPAFGEISTEDNFLGQLRGWDEALRFIFADLRDRIDLVVTPVHEIVFSTEADSAALTYKRQGTRFIDMSRYPALLGSLTRRVRFVAVLENTTNSVLYNAEARFFDFTHGVAVTGTTVDNTAAPDRSIATELTSGILTVGSGAGNIRSDAPAMYSVEFRAVGAIVPPAERILLGSAFLRISYE